MSDEIIKDEAVETKVDDIAEQQEAAAPEEDSKPRSNRARANRKAAAESEDSADNEDSGDNEEQVSEDEKVVLFVDHPIYWPAVGKLAKGFNVVPSHVADKWLEKGWARKASAAEVKKHYGV